MADPFPPPARPGPPALRAMLADIGVVLLLFAAAGALAGVLWPQLVAPVEVVRTELGNATDEGALVNRVSNDGWYALLAGVSGLVLGVVCTAWRRSHEVVTVLVLTAGAMLAALLSALLGGALGPEDPDTVLAGADVGATAPEVVRVYAEGVYLVWPVAALLGALVVLWSGERERGPATRSGGAAVSPAEPPAPSYRP